MITKTTKTGYWVSLVFFCLLMTADGITGIMQVEGGKEAMDQLSYPYYLMTIVGIGKVLGVIAILQNRFKTIKEWAFAGFAIKFIGASASWLASHGPISSILLPLIMLGIMFIPYFLWKKMERSRNAA